MNTTQLKMFLHISQCPKPLNPLRTTCESKTFSFFLLVKSRNQSSFFVQLWNRRNFSISKYFFKSFTHMIPISLLYHNDTNYYIIFSFWILQQTCWCPKVTWPCPFSIHFLQSFRGWLSCEALAEEGWMEFPSPAARLLSKIICRVMQGTPVPPDPSELPHLERMCCSAISACSGTRGSCQQPWWYLLVPLTGSALHRMKPPEMELHKDTIYHKLLASKTESRISETSVLLIWEYFENVGDSAGSRTSRS